MSYLLDTCVLSEYIKKQPTPQVITWLDEQDEERLFISAISIGEINKGIVKLREADPARADKLKTWLDTLEQPSGERGVRPSGRAVNVFRSKERTPFPAVKPGRMGEMPPRKSILVQCLSA